MRQTKTVFLVDDDIDDQEIFYTAMRRADDSVDCIFANDGVDALEKLQAASGFVPDLIFLDINMPRMNGRECLENIKRIEHLKHVPVYMYSTSERSISGEIKSFGAEDYIVKPSNIHDLTGILKEIIKKHLGIVCMLLFLFLALPKTAKAQNHDLPGVSALKKMSVEDLMNIEVTSVSKSPQKLTEAASSVQVITSEDIRRSPTTLLPEVLRLAPNLMVARAGSHDWSVTSRGFNGTAVDNSSLANKLLVIIDGRTVYNPFFGGVYWDVQSLLKENIDRIEVVSGPGGLLWGPNAINGVINIISKSARETQGLSFGAAYGNFLRDGFSLNYGSHIDSTFFFRVSGQRWDYNSSLELNGDDAPDQWNMNRGAFRMDYIPSAKNTFTMLGDLYGGKQEEGDSTVVNGQNILARWNHTFSERANFTFQVYYDRTWREIKQTSSSNEINTFDADLQHHFAIGRRNRISWGAAYRLWKDNTISNPEGFTPSKRTLILPSGFLQDQLTVIPKRLELTVGSKVLYNDYTGVEWQPGIRLAWTPSAKQTVWGSVSRSVRTPSRFDVDITSFTLVDHEEFRSEKVIAYELGYRFQPVGKLSLSLATFYNNYTDLRSFDQTGNPAATLVFGNNLEAKSWGLELSGNYIMNKWWRLRGGYTFTDKDFTILSDKTLTNTETLEAVDPKHYASLQSIMDLPKNFEFDMTARFVDALPEEPFFQRKIPAYCSLNVRLGWSYKFISAALTIQNLTEKVHREFGTREIPRSIHGRLAFRF